MYYPIHDDLSSNTKYWPLPEFRREIDEIITYLIILLSLRSKTLHLRLVLQKFHQVDDLVLNSGNVRAVRYVYILLHWEFDVDDRSLFESIFLTYLQ